MIDFENYERVTRRNEHSHGILKDVDMEETGAFIEVIGNIYDNKELLK